MTIFKTNQLTESMADMLVSNGILTDKCPSKIHTDYDYYVAKLAKKLNITFEDLLQLLQVVIDRSWILPLFDNDHSYLVSHPFTVLLKECLHVPYSEIVDPSPDDLIQFRESYRQRS